MLPGLQCQLGAGVTGAGMSLVQLAHIAEQQEEVLRCLQGEHWQGISGHRLPDLGLPGLGFQLLLML